MVPSTGFVSVPTIARRFLTNGSAFLLRTDDGAYQLTSLPAYQTADDRPLLLIGTFNKIFDYSRGIFRDLHYRFRSTLGESDQLVVCGYSFGDKGVNAEIIEWYFAKRNRKLLIIDSDCEQLFANARGAIQKHWKDDWVKNESIKFIAGGLEDVGIDEFMGVISRDGRCSGCC